MDLAISETEYRGSKAVSITGLPTLYYTPGRIDIGSKSIEIQPPFISMMEVYFVCLNDIHYGYYSGLGALNMIHGSTQVPAVTDMKSNHVSEYTEYKNGMEVYRIFPATVKVNESNYNYLMILDVIEECYDYFEVDIEECIREIIPKLSLNKEGFIALLSNYSARTGEIIHNVFA